MAGLMSFEVSTRRLTFIVALRYLFSFILQSTQLMWMCVCLKPNEKIYFFCVLDCETKRYLLNVAEEIVSLFYNIFHFYHYSAERERQRYCSAINLIEASSLCVLKTLFLIPSHRSCG